MSEEGLNMVGDDYRVTINPCQYREANGETYSQGYTFNRVHMEFDPDEVFPDTVQAVMLGRALVYQYKDMESVKVMPVSVAWDGKGKQWRAQKQAYHCLSMLDSAGFVSGWRKA